MVLVQVFAVVGKHEIGRDGPFQLLEEVLDIGSLVGEVAVAELLEHDPLFSRTSQNPFGR